MTRPRVLNRSLEDTVRFLGSRDDVPKLLATGSRSDWCPSGEPATLAAALTDVLGDDELRASLARAGFVRVSAEFSIDRAVGRTQQLYDQLLEPLSDPREEAR